MNRVSLWEHTYVSFPKNFGLLEHLKDKEYMISKHSKGASSRLSSAKQMYIFLHKNKRIIVWNVPTFQSGVVILMKYTTSPKTKKNEER